MQFDMMRTMDNGAWPNRRLCFIQFKHCGCYSTVAKVAIKSFCFHANSCMHTYEMGNLFLLWMQLMKLDKIPSSTLTSSAMDVLSLSNLQIKFQFNCPPFYKHKSTIIPVIGFQIVLFAFSPPLRHLIHRSNASGWFCYLFQKSISSRSIDTCMFGRMGKSKLKHFIP